MVRNAHATRRRYQRLGPRSYQPSSPVSKAEESVGRVCRDRLRPVLMSLFSNRGEPIQFGSSQLLFPEWLRRVGLVGALIARSYICSGREDTGQRAASLLCFLPVPSSAALPQKRQLLFPFAEGTQSLLCALQPQAVINNNFTLDFFFCGTGYGTHDLALCH